MQRRRIAKSTWTVVGLLLVIPFITPLVWMIVMSLKSQSDMQLSIVSMLQTPFHWSNYVRALTFFPFFHDLWNTMVVSVLSAVGTLLSCSLTAYGLSLIRWRGREMAFMIVLSTMMLPPWTTLIPLYIIFTKLHWINTFLPLIVPNFFGISAYSIFILRQFLKRQSESVMNAARLDGANELQVFWHIVVPIARPALIVVFIFNLTGNWTDFFSPLIYINNPKLFTLMLGLQAFLEQHARFENLLMAASFMVILPMILAFFLGQRKFVEGLQFAGNIE